ncbi:hypothetical protein ACFL35_08280 [Candidatus Riflebacteria bacterium]
MYFEGPEKKLEIFLKNSIDLFKIPDREWDSLVKAAGANILSRISNNKIKAFLLSESSLFVYKDRIILITCGKTILVNTIPRLLSLIAKEHFESLFYERKNENFPQAQISTFQDDVNLIQKEFKGKILRFGKGGNDHILLFHSKANYAIRNDVTLEILMHEPASDLMQFFLQPDLSITAVRERLKLYEILEDYKLDNYLFEPFGFSLNGIKNENYYTIHVTPQKNGPYCSFETNQEANISEIIDQILALFRPVRASILLYLPHEMRDPLKDHPGFIALEEERFSLECGYKIVFKNLLLQKNYSFSVKYNKAN